MFVLNIAAGKFEPLPLTSQDNLMLPKYVVNVDTSYFSKKEAADVEEEAVLWGNNPDRITKYVNLNMDVFEFMERTSLTFNRVVIYRFLEHVSFTQIEYFIYLVSTVLDISGHVDVIVPNYTILAQMLLDEPYNPNPDFNFEAHNILLTTEMLNEPSCPHASIWTAQRMEHFWELEDRFTVLNQDQIFSFDGRAIYLRSTIQRI